MEQVIIYFFMVQKLLNLKQTIVATPLCLENISKEFSVDNMERTGLYGYFYIFSADYDAIAVNNILDIDKYLMKKNGII